MTLYHTKVWPNSDYQPSKPFPNCMYPLQTKLHLAGAKSHSQSIPV
jgi:hypothetical protein